jgi:predicted  nucleic acid-binding Zn-ribbon protein
MTPENQAIHNAIRAAVAESIAPLREQIGRIEKKQGEHSKLLESLTAQLDELSNCVFQLEGQGISLDHRVERAHHTAFGTHQIVMQAERQMQQEIAALKQRLLDLTADVHKLHLIRESPEYKISALKAEVDTFQRGLATLERGS